MGVMKIAAENSKRNLAYFKAILKRWKSDGYGSELPNQRTNGKGYKSQRPAKSIDYSVYATDDDDYDPAEAEALRERILAEEAEAKQRQAEKDSYNREKYPELYTDSGRLR